jgi:hypothetical protein
MRRLPVPARPRAPRPAALAALLAVVVAALLAGPLTTPASGAATTRTQVSGVAAGPTSPDPDLGADSPHLPKRCFGPGNDTPPAGPCFVTKYHPKRPSLVLWGDSHAYMFLPAVQRVVKGRGVNLVTFVAGSCPPTRIPVTRGDHYSTKCELEQVLALRWVTRQQRAGHHVEVVLGSNWEGFRSAWRDVAAGGQRAAQYNDFTKYMITLSHDYTAPLFARLRALKVPTDVLAQAATVPDAEQSLTACTVGRAPYDPYVCDLLRSRAIPEESQVRAWLHQLMRGLVSARYIDTTGVYCSALICRGQIGGVYTWYDHLHLSATRTATMWRYFLPAVRDVLRR